jgi:hypothetical protein
MRTKYLSILAAVLTISLTLACHSNDDPDNNPGPNPPVPPDNSKYTIYVAGAVGYYMDSPDPPADDVPVSRAALWKDGKIMRLDDGMERIGAEGSGLGLSVFATANDVHMVGKNSAGTYFQNGVLDEAAYWKNNEDEIHFIRGNDSEAASVYVSGDDVYAAGAIFRYNYIFYPVGILWINDGYLLLSDPYDWTINTRAYSVFVSEGDVSAGGFVQPTISALVTQDKDQRATIWKNGEIIFQDNDDLYCSCINSVFVSGGNVYAVGTSGVWTEENVEDNYDLVATLWINGKSYLLAEEYIRPWNPPPWGDVWHNPRYSIAHSVFVSGEDVYVAGAGFDFYHPDTDDWDGKARAMLWKNGEQMIISDPNTYGAAAYSVNVIGDDIFIAGSEFVDYGALQNQRAVLWKNGIRQVLPLPANYAASTACSVFVMEKNPK